MFRIPELPSLQYLNFHFQTSLPFWGQSAYDSHDPWLRVGIAVGTTRVSCQKVFVDWFFTLAFDSLRHVPLVSYSGHIKDSTRRKWDKIFQDERDEKRVHGFSREITGIQRTLWQNLPPVCICKKACDFWNVRGPHQANKVLRFQPGGNGS
jgi:hypothetical protein